MMRIYGFLFLLAGMCTAVNCKSKTDVPTHVVKSAAATSEKRDTVSKSLYPDGRLEEVILNKDSAGCLQEILNFYPNGVLKSMGCQGYYADSNIATGAFVGTWSDFDSSGKLEKTTYYHNDAPAKAFIEKVCYYPNGNKRSVERFNNYELYEAEPDSIGEWKYFDAEGKLVNSINHKNKP